VLADNVGKVAGEVVRPGLGDLEKAGRGVVVAGRVGGVDRDPRFDLGEGLV